MTPLTTPQVPRDTEQPNWCTSAYRVTDDIRDSILDYFAQGTPSVDAFANPTNARFRRYWTLQQDPFQQEWSPTAQPLLWITPPFEKMDQVLDKIVEDGARAILIAPDWKQQKWHRWLQLLSLNTTPTDKKVKLYMNDTGRIFPQQKWGTTAYLVDGDLELVAATDGAQHLELPSLDHRHKKYWTDLSDPVVETMVRKLRAEYKGLCKRDAQRSIRGILTADKETLPPEAQVHLNRIKA